MELNPSKGKCESSTIYLLNEIECLVSKGLASELFCWLSSSCCVGIRRTVSAPVTAARAGTIAASMPAATPSQHLSPDSLLNMIRAWKLGQCWRRGSNGREHVKPSFTLAHFKNTSLEQQECVCARNC